MQRRVLCISHTAVSRVAGRLRYLPFAGNPDWDIHLAVPDVWQEFGRTIEADPPPDQGVTTHVLPIRWRDVGRAKWYLHYYTGLRSLLARIRPDIIHLWEEPWSLVALQAARLRNLTLPRTPLILEVDQNLLKRLPVPFELVRRRVLNNADFILGRSRDAVSVVRGCGYSGPASLIGYGVDRGIFVPRDKQAARDALNISGFTIGYVGRLVPEKGLAFAIQAIARTKADISIAIMGDGPQKTALQRLADSLNVAHRIRFFPWGQPHDVAHFMNALDALVLLTYTTNQVREQFGRVVIEAHGCGVPVIGTDCGAIPYVVGEGGWIIPEQDTAELAELLDRLAANPILCAQAAQAGLRQVEERHNFPALARVLADSWEQAYVARARAPVASRSWATVISRSL